VGGGLGVVGVGGMCVGGAGNDSMRMGTGGRLLATGAAIVDNKHERNGRENPPVIPNQPIPFSAISHFFMTKQISIDQLFRTPLNPSDGSVVSSSIAPTWILVHSTTYPASISP